MLIIHKINMDLQLPHGPDRINVVQGDAYTRQIQFSLFSGGQAFPVPEGVRVLVRFRNSAGVDGVYDTLPDGSGSAAVSGNTVTVTLAPPVTATPGIVHLAVSLIQDNAELTTFTTPIVVQRNPSAAVNQGGSYVSVKGLLPASGWKPGKYLGTDEDGKVVEKEAPSGGNDSGQNANYNPVTKTEDMTQPVGVDENGRLYTAPGGGLSATIEGENLILSDDSTAVIEGENLIL